MSKKEIEIMASMHAVQVMAIALLADVISQISPATHEQIAELFERRAAEILDSDLHPQLARTALIQMANAIRGSQPGGESWEDLLTRLRS